MLKLDHHFSDRHSLSLRYGYDHGTDPDPLHNDRLPGIGATSEKAVTQGLAAQLTSEFRSDLVNTLSFGWNRIAANFACSGQAALDGLSQQDGTLDRFGNGRDYILYPFTPFGCALASDGQSRKTGTVSYGDGLSWVRGQHTFKFGFDFRDVGESGPNNFFSRRQLSLDPSFAFNSTFYSPVTVVGGTTALDDAAAAYYGIVADDLNAEFFNKNAVRQPTDNKYFRAHEYDGFAQDTWKLEPNLSLTLGLRYQFERRALRTEREFLQSAHRSRFPTRWYFPLWVRERAGRFTAAIPPNSSLAWDFPGILARTARPRSAEVSAFFMIASSATWWKTPAAAPPLRRITISFPSIP